MGTAQWGEVRYWVEKYSDNSYIDGPVVGAAVAPVSQALCLLGSKPSESQHEEAFVSTRPRPAAAGVKHSLSAMA